MEKKHKKMAELNRKKAEVKQEKIMMNMRNLEMNINYQKEKLIEKQKENEEKKHNFEHLRQMAFKERQNKNMKRAEEIQKVLLNNEMMEKQRYIEYRDKQDMINFRKKELDELQNEIKKIREEKNIQKEEEIKEKIFNYYSEEEKRKKEIMDKIENKDYIIKYLKEEKEREIMERSENHTRIRMEKEDNIRRIGKMQEYERENTFKKLMEKNAKVEEFIGQKSLITERKREMQDVINQKKEESIKKFDRIFKKRIIDVENKTNFSSLILVYLFV